MCEFCGKGHRSEKAQSDCAARAERAAKRIEKKAEDTARREKNLALSGSIEAFVVRRYAFEGANADKVVAELKKNYPPPEPTRKLGEVPWCYEEWTTTDVVYITTHRTEERKVMEPLPRRRRRPSRILARYDKTKVASA